jgi:hypothetical protein
MQQTIIEIFNGLRNCPNFREKLNEAFTYMGHFREQGAVLTLEGARGVTGYKFSK